MSALAQDNRPAAETESLHVLVVDDEAAVREAYRDTLVTRAPSGAATEMANLRAQLFGAKTGARALPGLGKPVAPAASPEPRFEPQFAANAREAVDLVAANLARGVRFSTIFLDMRMPPGENGLWAAEHIRHLDPEVDIVICSAYSDVEPATVIERVPPADRLFFLQKPFHPHEVRQLARALGAKRSAQAHVHNLAYFDPLTGLANRANFREAVGKDLRREPLPDGGAAVLFIDLDHFKRINDTLGHRAGDGLLREVAFRLNSAVRSTDTVVLASPGHHDNSMLARQGGDEFIVYLSDVTTAEEARVVARRMLERLTRPVEVDGHELLVGASIGIALWPEHGATIDELLKHADIAMYCAKRDRGDRIVVYDRAMSEATNRRLAIESGLRQAIPGGALTVSYQPIVEQMGQGICSMEALVRWICPGIGNIAPVEFLPVAEESGLMWDIGEFVLRRACRDAMHWLKEDLPLARVAVNVAPSQLLRPEFPALVAEVLHESGLPPHHLEIEITEDALSGDEAGAERAVRELKALGVLIAIDDFGAGYSSLGRLKNMAVDRLKIDRQFISQIANNGRDAALSRAIIDMATALGMHVTAEGVEYAEQIQKLQPRNRVEVQGFLFSKPLPENDAAAFLRRLHENTAVQRMNTAIREKG
ncbi:MAG: EAL domain-containing protein [Proteobacteria bacterium]|nr:EAL domain-containing protein [Pseudomonadota bacterium]